MCFLIACRETEKVKTISEAAYYPGERAVDKPADLVHYFDSLCRNAGAKVLVHSPEEGDSLAIWEGIKELDRYARGLRKYYPEKTVKDILRSLAFCQGYEYSHIAHEEKINSGEIFFVSAVGAGCPILSENGFFGRLSDPRWASRYSLLSGMESQSSAIFIYTVSYGRRDTSKDRG